MHNSVRDHAITPDQIRPPGEMTLAAIQTGTALEKLRADWDVLCATLPLQTPFATADWNILWWRHLRAARLLIHDRLYTIAVRDERGDLIAIAPMMISVRPGLGPFGIKVLQFFGADPNVTEVRGLICHPAHSDAVLAALHRFLLHREHLWDWVEWQGLSAQQAAHCASPDVDQPAARVMCYLPLPATWDELKAGLSRNMKEAIRKCVNSLRRDRLQPALVVLGQPSDTSAALDEFFRLHALRAASTDGVAHADTFRDRKSRDFLREYAMAMAQRGTLRIFQLRLHDEVIATRIGFVLEGQLYLYFSGYDPAWGRYSIMTTLVMEAMQWAIARGCHCVHLSTGRDPSKQRWQPQEVLLHNAIQISPRLRAGLLFRAYSRLRDYGFSQRLSRKK